jgi:ion channel-forming bestrophin family protein
MHWEKENWFKMALRAKGSVIPVIIFRVLGCALFGLFISVLFYYRLPVYHKSLANTIPAVVLGLLLVFRTNTAYDRFWEGRKAWGAINNNVRNLARLLWLAVEEKHPQDYPRKIAALHLLPAFAIATKLHLRSQPLGTNLAAELSPVQLAQLEKVQHPALQIAFWLSDYLQSEQRRGHLHLWQMNELQQLVNNLVDMLGVCERILRTPMPLAYSIHLKQLLLIYCLLMPFQFVGELGWWTGPVVGLVSFTLLGIEAIGVEIENPFGNDPNDLPLDNICVNIQQMVADVINYANHASVLPSGASVTSELDGDMN